MTKTQLYIFVTSNAPDIYINVLRHCSQHYNLEKDVFFVGIFEDSDKQDDAEAYLNLVIQRVKEQITNLTKGDYFSSKEKKVIPISFPEHYRRKYSLLLDLKLTPKPILYKNLETELQNYIDIGIFDVSGFQKDYLVDVYTILHLLKNSKVFYFKIKKLKDRTFDDKELIHNLVLHTDYEFENISESPITAGTSVNRSNSIEEVSVRDARISTLTEGWANSYANMITNIFRIVLIISLIILIVGFYNNIGKWDKIEPWTFLILAPFLWVINLFGQVFTGRKMQDALTFDNLKDYFKNRKLKKILNNK